MAPLARVRHRRGRPAALVGDRHAPVYQGRHAAAWRGDDAVAIEPTLALLLAGGASAELVTSRCDGTVIGLPRPGGR
jgi:hypothetical protein